MGRHEAAEQYEKALASGKRCYRECVHAGRYPYLQALDELIDETEVRGYESIGLVEVPMELVAGTRVAGRRNAFAANFMPLLGEQSEFAYKWISLCEAHLSDEGIRDPVEVYEYLGRFYVQEGNKRVSVLKSFGAASVTGTVTRVLPAWSDDEAFRVYGEFLRFYALSRTYLVRFTHEGRYARLQEALGFEPDYVWSDDERKVFSAAFHRFGAALATLKKESEGVTTAEALLAWLSAYPVSALRSMSQKELEASIAGMSADISSAASGPHVAVSSEPAGASLAVVSRIVDTVVPHGPLRVAFAHESEPAGSPWLEAHEHGREYLEQALAGQVTTSSYAPSAGETPEDAMERAAQDGADVIVATTPTLVGPCRRVAADHPGVKVLDCSPFAPSAGVRTFYGRMFEPYFIAGAIAGAVSGAADVGLVADSPETAAVCELDAFALGVELTNPTARVLLRWGGGDDDAFDELATGGSRVICHCGTTARRGTSDVEGLYLVSGGRLELLAVPVWNWGSFYARLVGGILGGSWDSGLVRGDAVSYWWGMRSGVVDLRLGRGLPEGCRVLAELLRRDIMAGDFDVFCRRVERQDGTLFCDESHGPDLKEIVAMDFLCSRIDGELPRADMQPVGVGVR